MANEARPRQPRLNLEDLLLRHGAVDADQLARAREEQDKWGGDLGRILVDLGFINEELLVRAQAHQLGIPAVNPAAHLLTPDLVRAMPVQLCERFGIIAVQIDEATRRLRVATSDPGNAAHLTAIGEASGWHIEAAAATMASIEEAIRRNYYGEGHRAQGQRSIPADPPKPRRQTGEDELAQHDAAFDKAMEEAAGTEAAGLAAAGTEATGLAAASAAAGLGGVLGPAGAEAELRAAQAAREAAAEIAAEEAREAAEEAAQAVARAARRREAKAARPAAKPARPAPEPARPLPEPALPAPEPALPEPAPSEPLPVDLPPRRTGPMTELDAITARLERLEHMLSNPQFAAILARLERLEQLAETEGQALRIIGAVLVEQGLITREQFVRRMKSGQ